MSLTAVELRLLRGIVAGKTADELGTEHALDAASVARLLRTAEARCRLQFVKSDGRRLIATAIGEQVAHASDRLMAQMNGLDQFLNALRVRQQRPVRILAAHTPVSYVLPHLLGQFLREHPHEEIQLQGPPASPLEWATTRNNLAELFLGGTYDFAVLPLFPRLPDALVVEPLYDDVVVLFAGPRHRLWAAKGLRLADLRDETIVGMFIESTWTEISQQLVSEQFTRPLQVVLHSSEAVKRLVANGVGIGVLLASAIRDELENGTLRVLVATKAPVFERSFALVRHPAAPVTPIAAELQDYLRAHIRRAAAVGEWLPTSSQHAYTAADVKG